MINRTLHEKNTCFFLMAILIFGLLSALAPRICIAKADRVSQWYSPIITLSGGVAGAHIGRSQTLTMENDYTTYQYVATHSSTERFFFGIYTGAELTLNPRFLLQMGVGFYEPGAFSSAKNTLIQGVDFSSSDLFSWRYKTKNKSLLIETKLLGAFGSPIHPFLSLGLGASFNQAHDYTANIPSFLTFTPKFTNHTQTNFTYAVGIGMDADMSKKLRLGVSYRFASLGQVNLGEGSIDDKLFSGTLKQSNLYMHSLIAQLTLRFG